MPRLVCAFIYQIQQFKFFSHEGQNETNVSMAETHAVFSLCVQIGIKPVCLARDFSLIMQCVEN